MGEWFDDLARSMAGGKSRRGVLKTLGLGLVGVVAGTAGAKEASANPPEKHCKFQGYTCKNNADCCTLLCCNRTCCGDNQTCSNGQCVAAPACGGSGQPCCGGGACNNGL